jgi:CelD/BcsL family acetyltransferase involved in cellulose biosynthesis
MADLTVETLTGGLELFTQLGDEWREFLGRVQNDSPYWRPEWILAALRAYSPQAKVVVVTVRQQGSLCALLPLVEERGNFAGLPARKLRAPLTTVGVGVDIPCAVSGSEQSGPEQDAAITLIWSALKARKGWDVLELPSVFEGAAITQLSALAENDAHRTGSWTIPLIAFFVIPQGPAAIKDLEKYPRHPKLRSKVRQRETKLAALGSVRLLRTEKNGAKDLRRFYDMEAAGWKGKEKSAIIADPRSHQFFDEVTQEAEKAGHLCLYTLELDGKAIASHIGFTYRGRYWAAKSTYDENYRDYAPGHLIVKAILQDCAEHGVSEYVMGIREDWKMEWTQDVRKRSYQCIFNRGLWPRALHAIRFSLRPKLKALRAASKNLMARRSKDEGPKNAPPKSEGPPPESKPSQ